MALPRQEVADGLAAELARFEDLVRSVDDSGWAAPTRCEGWTVGDVAAHVIGTMTDVVNFRLDGLGTPEVTARQVEERRGRTANELADELAGTAKMAAELLPGFDDEAWASKAPGTYDGTLGDGVEALWYDAYLHSDDIRSALDRASERGDGTSLKASISHLATVLASQGWGPATLALDGVPEWPVGDGSGPRVQADAFAFVLAATGRAAPSTVGLDETVNVYR